MSRAIGGRRGRDEAEGDARDGRVIRHGAAIRQRNTDCNGGTDPCHGAGDGRRLHLCRDAAGIRCRDRHAAQRRAERGTVNISNRIVFDIFIGIRPRPCAGSPLCAGHNGYGKSPDIDLQGLGLERLHLQR